MFAGINKFWSPPRFIYTLRRAQNRFMSRNINFILNIMALENIKNYNLEKSDDKKL